jgi:hypothetical protein
LLRRGLFLITRLVIRGVVKLGSSNSWVMLALDSTYNPFVIPLEKLPIDERTGNAGSSQTRLLLIRK